MSDPTPGQGPDLVIDGHVATLTLRRPAVANRLELSDLEALGAELETLLDDARLLDALDLCDVEPETLFDMQGP